MGAAGPHRYICGLRKPPAHYSSLGPLAAMCHLLPASYDLMQHEFQGMSTSAACDQAGSTELQQVYLRTPVHRLCRRLAGPWHCPGLLAACRRLGPPTLAPDPPQMQCQTRLLACCTLLSSCPEDLFARKTAQGSQASLAGILCSKQHQSAEERHTQVSHLCSW